MPPFFALFKPPKSSSLDMILQGVWETPNAIPKTLSLSGKEREREMDPLIEVETRGKQYQSSRKMMMMIGMREERCRGNHSLILELFYPNPSSSSPSIYIYMLQQTLSIFCFPSVSGICMKNKVTIKRNIEYVTLCKKENKKTMCNKRISGEGILFPLWYWPSLLEKMKDREQRRKDHIMSRK